ncbi:MAG TPA: ATP-binding protein [Spirochaetota bacterium]|nr:ATP-binding protein [Spirochaetota bacterium]HSA14637.1 ATP-binding protein [Spirochaetota bacterium]
MKIRTELQKLEDYFLESYRERDFITYQKARTFLAILLTILLVVCPVFIVSNILRVSGIWEKSSPSLLLFTCIAILVLFKKGKFTLSTHLLLTSTFLTLWLSLFFGNDLGNAIVRMDSIALVLALLTIVPLLITRRARDILIYFILNSIVLGLFCIKLKIDYGYRPGLLSEYFLDNFIAMVFIGVTSYLIYLINRRALEKAKKAEKEVQAQNEELRASNEEFEAINEELMQSQMDLKDSEERYRNIIQSIEEGYFETDLKGGFTFVNSSLEKISGYSNEELICMRHTDYTTGEWTKRIYAIFNELYTNGKPAEVVDYEILTKGGIKKIIEMSASLIKDPGGRTTGFRGIVRDVTRKKKEEDEREKIKRIESIGLLAGGIAHDFNNILTSITGNISLAKTETKRGSGTYDLLDAAEKASLRARDLTQQLLTFSKGGAPIKKLTSIADLLIDTATFVLRGSKVGARFFIDSELRSVEIDSGQISQVIHNLIINASQAMPDGGTVTITADNATISDDTQVLLPAGDYVVVSIQDQGSGIPKSILNMIFDPYFTTKEDGTGLGLTISYSIVKKHGGHIAVDSSAGEGACFRVYLPASDKTPVRNEENPFPDKKTSNGIKRRVLVMEDDDMVAEITIIMLKRIGFMVDRVTNGMDAIDMYKMKFSGGDPYDLVIMDLTIPGGMGGKEAIAELREFDPRIKAVVSSGYSNDPVMAGYNEYGFCGFIVKPYTINDLDQLIRGILD